MSKLYTAKDVERCYPWITAWTTNHRVKKGALRIEHPSPGSGIPNLFTLPELIHCAVVDELSSLGVFGVQHSTATDYPTSVHYHDPFRHETGEKREKVWTGEGVDPYYVDYDFYKRHDYRVVVEVQVRHDILPGTNIPKNLSTGPARFYVVSYGPESFEGKSFIDARLDYWLSPNKDKFNRLHAAKGFIRVRQLYELARETLGLD